MSDVRLLGDMHISPKTVTALKQEGWNIIRVSDALPKSASDSEILNLARQDNRTVVTQDLDFSMLLALGSYSQPSLITLRLSSSEPDNVSQKLLEVLPGVERALWEGCAITIGDDIVRIRKLPIK